MKLARNLPKILIILGLIGGGGYVAQKQGLLADSGLDKTWQDLSGQVMGLSDSAAKQTEELTKKSRDVGQHVNNVLGDYIEPTKQSSQDSLSSNSSSAEKKPVYEETFEYGRYLYCQQVIKDYEFDHRIEKSD